MSKELVVWTKFCVPCVNREGWDLFEEYCKKNGYIATMIRTTYLPQLHEQATALYGSENYTIFIQKDGQLLDFDYAVSKIRAGEELFVEPIPEKTVRIAKKPIKRGKRK